MMRSEPLAGAIDCGEGLLRRDRAVPAGHRVAAIAPSNYGNYKDPEAIATYDRMVRETDFPRQRELIRQFDERVLDTEAHEIFLLWRYRIVPYRSYVKGCKISPSHYVNQDLATIWLDK